MKDGLQVLWLRPLRKLSSLMLSENPCSEGNSVYRHTGCSDFVCRHTDTDKQVLRGLCSDLTIDLHTCSAPDTPAIEEVGQCGGDLGNNPILRPKIHLLPLSIFHQYHVVVQLHKITNLKIELRGTSCRPILVIGDA